MSFCRARRDNKLSKFIGPRRVVGGNSVSSFRPIVCLWKQTQRVLCRTHPAWRTRNSIPPVSQKLRFGVNQPRFGDYELGSLSNPRRTQRPKPGLKFQARMKISSAPPTKAPFVENSEGQDLIFQARLKFSSETENFKQD